MFTSHLILCENSMSTPESRLYNSRIIDGIACFFSLSFFAAAVIGTVGYVIRRKAGEETDPDLR